MKSQESSGKEKYLDWKAYFTNDSPRNTITTALKPLLRLIREVEMAATKKEEEVTVKTRMRRRGGRVEEEE